jgi:hypothetical protein
MRITVLNGNPDPGNASFETHLRNLVAALGLGSVVKGGCEGVRLVPEAMNQKLFSALHDIGKSLAQAGRLDPELLRSLAQPERYPRWSAPFFKILVRTKMANRYWDDQLRENGVYEERFARPYA